MSLPILASNTIASAPLSLGLSSSAKAALSRHKLADIRSLRACTTKTRRQDGRRFAIMQRRALRAQCFTLQIVDAVHANKSFIFLQIWAGGRVVNAANLEKEGITTGVVSSGDIALDDQHVKPRPLTKAEIAEYVSWYARAARLAVEEAGFDGVEVHGANGRCPWTVSTMVIVDISCRLSRRPVHPRQHQQPYRRVWRLC